jgi:hypothetical protein
MPIHLLQLIVGVLLLLLFGMGWLRKAILRSAGVIPLHDEDAIFASESAQLAEVAGGRSASLDWIAGLTAFKAVLLEGLEVAFIVIAVGSGKGLLWPAAVGALGACVAVLAVGIAVHKPLARVPENTLPHAPQCSAAAHKAPPKPSQLRRGCRSNPVSFGLSGMRAGALREKGHASDDERRKDRCRSVTAERHPAIG